MPSLHILSGGAAQGLVRQLQPAFETAHGVKLDGTFGAVGAMKQRLLEGAPCDVLILTHALIEELVQSGQVRAGSAQPLGLVKTGIAVKTGAPWPEVASTESLRQALGQASGIYFPDPQLATAGIHFMKVLNALGIASEVAERLRPFPNGATAMRAMAECEDLQVIGCTQVTEILFTPGVDRVADLPATFELATLYTAGVCRDSAHPQAGAAFIAECAGPGQAERRQHAGFLPAP